MEAQQGLWLGRRLRALLVRLSHTLEPALLALNAPALRPARRPARRLGGARSAARDEEAGKAHAGRLSLVQRWRQARAVSLLLARLHALERRLRLLLLGHEPSALAGSHFYDVRVKQAERVKQAS